MDKRKRDAIVKALRDTAQSASNAIAANVSGPIDLISMGLRTAGVPIPANAVGGSQWMADKGLTREVEMGAPRIIGETLGMAGPAVAVGYSPKIAAVANKLTENAGAPAQLNKQAGVVTASLSKRGDPQDAGAFFKDAIAANQGKIPFDDVSQMTKAEFDKFYDALAPHHQGKFDRLLRAYAPNYDDLPKTMQQYAQDFRYENPRIVSKFARVKPDDMVDVYRSVTKADPDAAILPGDWIALERSYAAQHGRLGADAPRMLKGKVPAKDIRWAGTSADEYFYVPSENVSADVGTKYDALQRHVIEALRQKQQ
jgi:hypothetical protein